MNGTLTLGGNDRLAATGALNFGSSFVGTFALAGFNRTVGDLSGNGTVSLGAGTLTGGAANSTAFGGAMTGTGNFVKEGTGTLTFTGNKTFNGTTTINNGTLIVNGTDANSAVTVNAAGTLGGSGTVGATDVFGTIAPGNSIGTLTVNGSFTQSAARPTSWRSPPEAVRNVRSDQRDRRARHGHDPGRHDGVGGRSSRRLHHRHPLHHPDRPRRRDRHLYLAGRERCVPRLRARL